MRIQRDSLKRLSAEFHHADLDDKGEDENNEEEGIIEEIFEYVNFLTLELTGVDFIKNLQQHKCVEKYAVMLSRFICPILHCDRRLDTEKFRA